MTATTKTSPLTAQHKLSPAAALTPAAGDFPASDSVPRCHASDCRARAEDGTVRTIGGERWFVCEKGHVNAELVDDFREAA